MGGGKGLSESVSWFGVEHPVREAVEIFSTEIAPAGTGMGKEPPHTFTMLSTNSL